MNSPRYRRILVQREMCPCADDDMVKTVPPDRADQPIRMAILPWRLGCSWPVANAHGTKRLCCMDLLNFS